MKSVLLLFTLFLACTFAFADTYLTPLDFGLKLMDHGMVDYVHTPPHIRVGLFNGDDYPDIARFEGNKLQVFLFQGAGYTPEPQLSRTFDQPIQSLGLDDDIWDGIDDLVVTLADGCQETFCHRGGGLDWGGPAAASPWSPPRRLDDLDFQIVWESEPRPWGMDRCAVGDLDNDGINELVTWYKESHYADSAFFLIYKSIGDNEYELFMEERFYVDAPGSPSTTAILIADMDRNGLKELIYTLDRVYIWEFSGPGQYAYWNCSINFSRAVADVEVCDVDQDSILELAFVTSNYGMQPPTLYMVKEFSNKGSWPEYTYVFTTITGIWQDWEDDRLAVGDFDNDGAVDIVSGNFASVGTYDPVDIQYFRYDSTTAYNFTQEWLHTGIPLSCATPVIADLDEDGQNELFAGGHCPGHGSAFMWEATGCGSGYVAWLDTVNILHSPNESAFGMVDWNPAVISLGVYWTTYQVTDLYLFGLENSLFSFLWGSPPIDSVACHSPLFFDTDQDNKMNILMGAPGCGSYPNRVMDWEQISAGIWENPKLPTPVTFRLCHNYPNPFNRSTIIPFEICRRTDIQLLIYDLEGRIVYEYKEENLNPGYYEADWNASGLPSGIYLIRLKAGKEQQVRKGMLMK